MYMSDIEQALQEAKTAISVADAKVAAMTRIISGRLRISNPHPAWSEGQCLNRLKRELRKWDMTKMAWKD